MKQRIITGLIGGALVISALFLRETIVFNILIGLALVLAMIESQYTTKLVDNTSLIILNCIFAFASAFIPYFQFIPTGLLITSLYILAIIVLTLSNTKEADLYKLFYSVGITLFLSFGLSSVLTTNNLYVSKDYMYQSSDCTFFLLLTLGGAWFGDIGAYFVGSRFGKHKIAPNISPKKSVEGLLGGMASTLVCILLIALVWNFAILDEKSYIQFGWLILISILCPVVGLIGDLFFSYIKRSVGIKDFGKIMPGHGGILDRVDSLVLVAPFISLVLMYIPIIVHK